MSFSKTDSLESAYQEANDMANFINKTAKISKLASIDISTRNTHTRIGANCQIDDFVKIKHVGGSGDVVIGDNVYINSGTVLYSGNGIKIGNDVLIGPNCSIVPVNHEFRKKSKLIREQRFMRSKGGAVMEDDVWIGAGVTILDGAHIKKGAVIGANSLVKGVIGAYSINVGVPCRKVGSRK
jgi:virginiamycin A acetyltransferase